MKRTDGQAHYLVLDLGTGGIHAGLIGEDLDILDSGYHPISYRKPERGEGWEFEPEALFRSVLDLAIEVLSRASSVRGACRGIVVTGQRHGMVLVDRAGRELLGYPNIDDRAVRQAAGIARDRGAYVYDRTGRWPDYFFPAARLAWLREEAPESFAAVDRVLMINEWLAWRLTGVAVSEPTNAAETLFMDLPSLKWSEELRKLFHLEHIRPNDLIPSGATAGGLTEASASRLGLSAGVPVFLAHSDTQAAALGTGAGVGDIVVVNGSTTPTVRILDGFPRDPERRIWATPYQGGTWMVEANANVSGMVYRRLTAAYVDFLSAALKDLGISADRERLAEIAAAQGEWGRGGTGYWGPRVSDVKTGKRKDALLISEPGANPYKAVLSSFLENLAFAVYENILLADSVAGSPSSTIFLTGGGSRNEYFTALVKALFPDRPVLRTKTLETTSVGAVLSVLSLTEGTDRIHALTDDLRRSAEGVKSSLPETEVRRGLEKWIGQYSEIVYIKSGRNG